MARQQWRLRVKGKQRKQINVDLLAAAVIALGEQLTAEKREGESATIEGFTPLPPTKQEEAS